MFNRSPMNYIDGIAESNTKIFHGKHYPFVPLEQSLKLYRAVVEKYPQARVYLDIFDGRHEMDMVLASHWILKQYQKKQNIKVTN